MDDSEKLKLRKKTDSAIYIHNFNDSFDNSSDLASGVSVDLSAEFTESSSAIDFISIDALKQKSDPLLEVLPDMDFR